MTKTAAKTSKGKCKHCDGPVAGKKLYCDDACRMAFNRAQTEQQTAPQPEQSSNQPEQTQPEQPTRTEQESGPSIGHYNANPSKYAPRTNPHLLNWGKWMSGESLAHFGLVANRVPIPGDWDYVGEAAEPEPEQSVPVNAGDTQATEPESPQSEGGIGEGGGGA